MAAIDWISTVKDLDGETWLVNAVTSVPKNPAHRQARDVLQWIAAGNTPDAADPKPPPPTLSEGITDRLRGDPLARAQAFEMRDRLGLTNAQLLDLLAAKAGEAF